MERSVSVINRGFPKIGTVFGGAFKAIGVRVSKVYSAIVYVALFVVLL